MSDHTVFCVKLKKQLPGLDEPPFDTEFGRKIYDNVSEEAWKQWTEYCKMLLNEYRLNPARREDQEVIVKQMDQFFFGEGAAPPPEYVPPTQAKSTNSANAYRRLPLAAVMFSILGSRPIHRKLPVCVHHHRFQKTGNLR